MPSRRSRSSNRSPALRDSLQERLAILPNGTDHTYRYATRRAQSVRRGAPRRRLIDQCAIQHNAGEVAGKAEWRSGGRLRAGGTLLGPPKPHFSGVAQLIHHAPVERFHGRNLSPRPPKPAARVGRFGSLSRSITSVRTPARPISHARSNPTGPAPAMTAS